MKAKEKVAICVFESPYDLFASEWEVVPYIMQSGGMNFEKEYWRYWNSEFLEKWLSSHFARAEMFLLL